MLEEKNVIEKKYKEKKNGLESLSNEHMNLIARAQEMDEMIGGLASKVDMLDVER